MIIVNLDNVEFGQLISYTGQTGETINCIVGRQIGSREGDQESMEKLIIPIDFSEAIRVSMAIKLGLKFHQGHRSKQ